MKRRHRIGSTRRRRAAYRKQGAAFLRAAEAFTRMELDPGDCEMVGAHLRCGFPVFIGGRRAMTERALRAVAHEAAVQTEAKYLEIGHARTEAHAAGAVLRAHILGTAPKQATVVRAFPVGGWIAALAMMLLAEDSV